MPQAEGRNCSTGIDEARKMLFSGSRNCTGKRQVEPIHFRAPRPEQHTENASHFRFQKYHAPHDLSNLNILSCFGIHVVQGS
jgi:hypothetical protein